MTSTSVGLAELGEGVIAQAIGIALARLGKLDDVIGDDRVVPETLLLLGLRP